MPLSEKKKASNAKWDAQNLKRMSLAIPIALYERIAIHIAETGETVNGFRRSAIVDRLDKLNSIKDD